MARTALEVGTDINNAIADINAARTALIDLATEYGADHMPDQSPYNLAIVADVVSIGAVTNGPIASAELMLLRLKELAAAV